MKRLFLPLLGSLILAGCSSGSSGTSGTSVTGTITKTPGTGGSATGGTTVATATPGAPSTGVPAGPTVSPTSNSGGATTPGTASVKKSISHWVSCDGVSDDTAGVSRALAAARYGAFTLLVDCSVRIHSGLDIARVVYIDDGTTVEFTGTGKFTVDNVMHPAFVIANSHGVTLTDWNVEYDAGVPANPDVGGYGNNGQFIAVTGHTQPTGAWNDIFMTPWLALNRGIVFDHGQGAVGSLWASPTNTCAVFFITGDTFNMTVSGMNVHVPPAAGGDRFVPVVFSFSQNFKSNQTVTARTPKTAQFLAAPHDLKFSNITFDGTIMGWVGGVQNAVFEHIRSHRYGDLQDSRGENIGGTGKWFAPPHLFYLAYSPTGDPALFNTNLTISDVVDDGPRIGAARDKGGTDTISGYALSLKIGCLDCSVDNYKTTRPDGFLDVLPSERLTISNVDATYDSSFTNNLFPGLRFPSVGYKNLTFENIALRDSADSSIQPPIGYANDASNENIVFKNVRVGLNRWAGPGTLPLPGIAGHGNDVALDYTIKNASSRIVGMQTGTESLVLEGTSETLKGGSSTMLTWKSKDANSCSAGGAWAGAVATQGSHIVKLINAGTYDFVLNCRNAARSYATTLPIIVQ